MRLHGALILVVGLLATVLCAPLQVHAAEPACPLKQVTLHENQALEAPEGFDQLAFFDTKTKQSGAQIEVKDATDGKKVATISSLAFKQAGAIKKSPSADQTQLRWGKQADPKAECLQPFDVAAGSDNSGVAVGPVTDGVAGPETPVDVQDCQSKAQNEQTKIRNERKLGSDPDDFSLVVFCRDLTAMQISRGKPVGSYGVEGDPIYVVLYDDGTLHNPHAEIPTCSIEPAGPRIFQSETSLPNLGSTQAARFTITRLLNRACFDASVEIDLKAKRGELKTGQPLDAAKSYILAQAVRYHATLQAGPLFSSQQAHSFGLRVDDQNVKHVLDKGPTGRGTEYTASLVLYSLPRQLASLFGGSTFHGRDIVHETGFSDRIGGLLGAGLSEPNKLFVAGLSFEVLSYVNLVAAYSWARLPELAGVKDGDVFTGTADQIPVKDVWKGHFQLGIAIDLRYATTLLKR